jgi:hypothetical protein
MKGGDIMSKQRKCSLKVLSDDNKLLHGTAAQLHYVKEQGGWDAFIENITTEAATVAVKHAFREMEKAKFTSNPSKRKSS